MLDTEDDEATAVCDWLTARVAEGFESHEIGVFVRSTAELDRARAAVTQAGILFKVLDENVAPAYDHVSISTMHLVKGLEFGAVASWPATTRSFLTRNASKRSPTTQTWKRSATRNDTSCTWHALGPATTCS